MRVQFPDGAAGDPESIHTHNDHAWPLGDRYDFVLDPYTDELIDVCPWYTVKEAVAGLAAVQEPTS